jgi:lambda family phage tail tape measure protein
LIEGFERLKEIVAGFPDSTQTLEAAIGRISSAWDNFLGEAGKSSYTKDLINFLAETLNMASQLLKTKALNENSAELQSAMSALRSTEGQLKFAQEKLDETLKSLSRARNEGDIETLKAQEADLRKKVDILNEQRNKAEKNLRVLTKTTDEDYNKRNADREMQAQRKRDAMYKEELKTKELIEKIDKGKNIQKIKLETKLLRQQITDRAKLAKDAGKIDPVEENRLYIKILQNEEEAINKVLKTKIDGQLRLRGLKTRFDIEAIESEVSKNAKILEIEKKYAKRSLEIKSAVEAGKLELIEGVAPEFREGISAQKGEGLQKALKQLKDDNIADEINRITNSIRDMLVSADVATSKINKDKLGLLQFTKGDINQEFLNSTQKLKDYINSLSGTQEELNEKWTEGYAKLQALRDLQLQNADVEFNNALANDFSQQTVSATKYQEALNDLVIARERNIVTDAEYQRNLRVITLEYDAQTAKAQALSGELSGLEQIHKGLDAGARNFMENTSTMYEFYADSTEELLDASIGLIIDHSKSAQEAFKNLVRSMLVELQKLIIKRSILQAFGGFGVSTFGGGGGSPAGVTNLPGSSRFSITSPVPSANGNVFSGPGISAYSGTVVSKPTIFPFAKGMGLMGEAGEEAILPLKRGEDGKLGVASTSGGNANVVINNYSNSNIKTERGKDSAGNDIISVVVEDAINSMVQNGRFDTMMSPYNINRTGKR